MAGVSSIARRLFGDSRVRNTSFAVFFALIAYANVVGYRDTYSTVVERIAFARSFGANKALRLFYGVPHDLLSTGGYVAWRVGGTLSVAAAIWGVFAAVRALRAEEESGRQEIVLSGVLTRRGPFVAALAACAAGAAGLWLALFVALVGGKLPAGDSAYLALTTLSPALVFVGVGALTSQLAPSRRLALGLANGVLALAFVMRVVADTASGLGWLRWATPIGWSEEMGAFTGPRPAVLILPALATAILVAAAARIAARRDVGSGLIEPRDSAPPNLRLLSSPTALALRGERGGLAGWLLGIGFYALIMGLLSTSFSSASIPAHVQKQLRRVGGASLTTPAGALSFYFLLFVLAISLFACAQIAAMRREEAEQRLETLLALPVGRSGWLGGRIALAAAGMAALALAASVFAWVGATAQGAGVTLDRLLAAGANCLPAATLFLALATLAFASLPRASSAFSYLVVTAAFVWDLFGAILGAPKWLLDVSPFQHVGLVPAQPFRTGAALVMLAIAAGAGAISVLVFRRRDLAAG